MEQCGMVLNLHGECPSDHAKNITVLNAEVRIRGALFFQFGGVFSRGRHHPPFKMFSLETSALKTYLGSNNSKFP